MKSLVGGLGLVGLSAFLTLQGCSSTDTHSPSFTGFGGSAANRAGSNGALGGSAGSMNSAGGGGQDMGGSSGSGGGGDAALGGGGSGGSATDAATAFVPDVPEEYVGKIASPGMTVVAHTAREATSGKEWLMAVKNTGTDHLCAIDVSYSFLDATGAKLGEGTLHLLDIPIERGSNGTGGHTNCLAPGKIGMLKDTLALQDVDISKIAKVTHEFGAIITTDAVPTDDIKVTDVLAVAGPLGGQVFTGTLKNDSQASVKNPSVMIYGVNAVGRPLFASEGIELVTIPAAGTWMFKTTNSFDQTYTDFAAYPQVSDL